MVKYFKHSRIRPLKLLFVILISQLSSPLFAGEKEAVSPFHDYYLIGTGFVFLILCFFIAILIRKNKRLKSSNQNYIDQQRIVQDEKERLEEKLRNQEIETREIELKARIINQSHNPIIIANTDGILEWVNKGFELLYGYTLKEFIEEVGNNIHSLSTNPSAISEGVEHKKSVTYPSYWKNKNGKKVWLQVEFTPLLDQHGNIKKFIFIETDVSLYKVTESEILQQRQEVDHQLTITEMQLDQMHTKYKSFTDSINYARRIQSAILPSTDTLDRLLDDYFVLYKPRDVVSGDFYWISEIDGKKIIAVADCTGHGVPGAFMSILGISFLTEIVTQGKNLKASEILNDLRTMVLESLSQSLDAEEAKDGIDMALCIIDTRTMRLQFAGANNPLYLVRERKIKEIKGDRMPIGTHPNSTHSFTNHEIEICPGDLMYMFTDGYVDQFGWRDGKKFKFQALRRLILDVYDIPIQGQKIIMDNTIKNWMGNQEQIDDILVMGFKI
ncbi:MAG: SpoIIE family protein phosphatase [Bacteroidales bacterium]|nr:SpoIIE family protein phosphatase [Bacteroidales bacterium]MCF8458621.1 SpoIIE family protein phosphatase [Bacteroidales bacterium]